MNDAGGIFVEAAECVPDNFLWIGAVEALTEKSKEHGEVDRPGSLVHHRLQILVSHLFT